MPSNYDGPLHLREDEAIQDFPVASGVAIAVGEMLIISGSNVKPATATTDNLKLIGVAKEAHASTEGANRISVAIRNAHAVYKVSLDAATTVAPGDLLQMYTSAPSTKLVKSATDAVAMAVKGGTSVTTVEVQFLLPAQTGSIRLVGDAS
ncbi:MAG: hypothetical protein UMS36scaffold28_10 [Phage 59_13]|nr:MAG: hypothetical protein UMS36scaffold28_10 [Phage 59_13]